MAKIIEIDGAKCRALREQGWSLRAVALEMRCSLATVRYHTREISVKSPTQKRAYRRKTQLMGEKLPPSVALAYLIGVICGDGNLVQLPRTVQLSISCDGQYPELIEKYVNLLENVFGKSPSVHWRKSKNYAEIRLASKSLAAMLDLPTGAKTPDYPVPRWIFSNTDFVRPFLRGLIETDGNIYHEYRNGGWCSRCRFTNKNPAIMAAFLEGTRLLGYDFREVGFDARLTRTKEARQFAFDLDLQKNRVYIQKPRSAPERISPSLTRQKSNGM